MPFILSKSEALRLKCDNPGCDHTAHDWPRYVVQNCHTHSGLRVIVHPGSSLLSIYCHECLRPVAALEIDSRGVDERIYLDAEDIIVRFTPEHVAILAGDNEEPPDTYVELWELPWRE